MKLILLGAPGAGKGTQAEILTKRLNIPIISTGNIIREALSLGTEMGQKAKSFIEAGQLVPDEVVIGIVRDRIAKPDCANGFILDGFPRTIPQAEALMGLTDMDMVVNIDVPDQTVIDRMSGRRVCGKCSATYHITNMPPKSEGVCDLCGGGLIIRKDDVPETVLERLKVYHAQTEPLIRFYGEKGLLRTVDGVAPIEEGTDAILKALSE